MGLVILSGGAASVANDHALTPAVSVETPSVLFGPVGQNEQVEHRFRLKNRGEGDLLIQEVRAGCDVVTGDFTGRRIAPGSGVALPVRWETGNNRGRTMRAIEVETNDPEHPVVRLEIGAWVCQDFAVHPQSLVLRREVGSAVFSGTLSLLQCSDEPLTLSRVDASATWLRTTAVPLGDGRNGYLLTVMADGGAAQDGAVEVLSLHFEQGGPIVVDVPVMVPVASEGRAAVP